jgi:hypothetical protein
MASPGNSSSPPAGAALAPLFKNFSPRIQTGKYSVSLIPIKKDGMYFRLFLGRMMGLEPTNTGTTNRGLNHLATPAISISLNIVTKGASESQALFTKL